MSYAFFWVIPRRLKFICRRFATIQTPRNHQKESIQHLEHGESLKSRIFSTYFRKIPKNPLNFFKFYYFVIRKILIYIQPFTTCKLISLPPPRPLLMWKPAGANNNVTTLCFLMRFIYCEWSCITRHRTKRRPLCQLAAPFGNKKKPVKLRRIIFIKPKITNLIRST
jgi:hypothetical protein